MEASVEELHAELARLCAAVRARCRWRPVDHQIARWRAIDKCQLFAVRLVPVAHLLRRREAHAVAVAGGRAWLATRGERLLSAVAWRGLLPAWAPGTGRAPPAMGLVVLRQ